MSEPRTMDREGLVFRLDNQFGQARLVLVNSSSMATE